MIVGVVMPQSSVEAEKHAGHSAPQLREEPAVTESGNSFQNYLSSYLLLTNFKYNSTKASAGLHI
jgi:hypothetical protein